VPKRTIQSNCTRFDQKVLQQIFHNLTGVSTLLIAKLNNSTQSWTSYISLQSLHTHTPTVILIFFLFSFSIFWLVTFQRVSGSNFCTHFFPPDKVIMLANLYTSQGSSYVKVNVMFSLCINIHHAMKTYWGSGGISPRIPWPRHCMDVSGQLHTPSASRSGKEPMEHFE